MPSAKQLLMTMTGEIHQPVRLYYQVFDQAAVVKVFSALRCMDDDRDQTRWVWLYHGEAKKLKFHTAYSENRIYVYPYLEFKNDLSARSQGILQDQYEQAMTADKIVVFVRDNDVKRLVSYSV